MDKVLSHSFEMIKVGSKSFSGASKLLDKHTRESAILLYSWCRYCDDQIDNQLLGFNLSFEEVKESDDKILQKIEKKTHQAINNESLEQFEFEALRRVLEKHQIPEQYPIEHLEGFRMDVEKKQYHTITDTLD